MKLGQFARRFLVPSFLRTLIFAVRDGALVSPRAEVDLSGTLKLGRKVEIGSFAKLKATNGPLEIGARSSIGAGCFLSSGTAGIRIGTNCMIASGTSIVANNHRYDRLDVPMRDQGHTSVGITIEEDVWIGSNCTVLDGAHIESGAIVTAGSVVSGRVRANKIVSGNPARPIFERR